MTCVLAMSVECNGSWALQVMFSVFSISPSSSVEEMAEPLPKRRKMVRLLSVAAVIYVGITQYFVPADSSLTNG